MSMRFKDDPVMPPEVQETRLIRMRLEKNFSPPRAALRTHTEVGAEFTDQQGKVWYATSIMGVCVTLTDINGNSKPVYKLDLWSGFKRTDRQWLIKKGEMLDG